MCLSAPGLLVYYVHDNTNNVGRWIRRDSASVWRPGRRLRRLLDKPPTNIVFIQSGVQYNSPGSYVV